MYEKKKGNTYYTNRHSCFLLQYHLVLVTKYRHPVLEREIKAAVYSSIRDTFRKRGLNILEMTTFTSCLRQILSLVRVSL